MINPYEAANALLRNLVERYDAGLWGFSSWSLSVYDTAWVSIVSRAVPGSSTQWVFPECFDFIYNAQLEDGSWRSPGCNNIDDSIINSLVCLLSFKRHASFESDYADLPLRIEKGISFLRGAIKDWDVVSVERIAFEVILPRLLELLENEGIYFDLPNRDSLYDIYAHKLKKLDFETMYKPDAVRTGALHSLEAFVGICNFDRLAHHKRNGNFFASPASTAAYLMSVSTWDEEAENYLRHVIQQSKFYGNGAVSCAWPTTVMDTAWVCRSIILLFIMFSKWHLP